MRVLVVRVLVVRVLVVTVVVVRVDVMFVNRRGGHRGSTAHRVHLLSHLLMRVRLVLMLVGNLGSVGVPTMPFRTVHMPTLERAP